MYTNISNIIDTIIQMLERNELQINQFIHRYASDRSISFWKGMRTSLPDSAFPALEIEPTDTSNEWFATRTQSPTYNLEFTLTTTGAKEPEHLEMITGLVTMMCAMLTDPRNLQLKVVNSKRYNRDGTIADTFMLDSLVTSASYNSAREGTFRVAVFQWFGRILEPYGDEFFGPLDSYTSSDLPTS